MDHPPQQQGSSSTNNDALIFLPYDKWSPRYESQFYTIKMERYYIIRDPSDWPAGATGATTTTTTTSDDENEDMNSTITCQFCSRHRGGDGRGGGGEGGINKKKKKYPAVYYEIEILRGSGSGGGSNNNSSNNNSSYSSTTTITTGTKLYRRYSQFDTLLKQLDPYPNKLHLRKKYNFPPKTYMLDSWRSTDVLDERMVGLYNFICNILSQQLEYSSISSSSSNVDGGGVNSSCSIIVNFLEIL